MSGGVERWLARRWYAGVAPGPLLRLLARGYGWWVGRRAQRYRSGRAKSVRIAAPVWVVGNVVVGGTGKTPLTIALVRWLIEHGYRPGVVTRGYGRRTREPVWAEANGDPDVTGDEPILIASRTGVPVRVDRDRVAGARELLQAGCNVVVADDGLQHYRLGRDLEIEVVDHARGYGNGLMLPAGPLRESIARAHRCDLHVLAGTGPSSSTPLDGGAFAMCLREWAVVAMGSGERCALEDFRGRRVHAVAGIGNPQRFFASLRALGIEPIEHAFPDHHRFTARELRFDDDLPVLMTEKDAVKCRDFAAAHWFAVAVEAQLAPAFYHALATYLPGVVLDDE